MRLIRLMMVLGGALTALSLTQSGCAGQSGSATRCRERVSPRSDAPPLRLRRAPAAG